MIPVMPTHPGLSLQETIQPVPEGGDRLRFVTATSLFDGHDASINVMRRILQASGVEVIHLGHNRSVREIVDAAVEEDAGGIAVSSYQGGHTVLRSSGPGIFLEPGHHIGRTYS